MNEQNTGGALLRLLIIFLAVFTIVGGLVLLLK